MAKWIKKATEGGKGKFRAKAEKAGESTREFAKEHASSGGKLGRQARLAETLMKMHPSAKKMKIKMYGKED